jgi:prevent-host-death family protein
MTKSVGVREAKAHLSQLLEDVAAGEEVLITRNGEEIASLIPIRLPDRQLGIDQGRFVVPEDFDAPLTGELAER